MNAPNPMPRRRADAEEPQEELIPNTIRFPASLRKRAIEVALAEDRPFSSLVVYAVRRYVTDRERELGIEAGK
jgi:hypothetical protein